VLRAHVIAISFDNHERPHQALGYRTPRQVSGPAPFSHAQSENRCPPPGLPAAQQAGPPGAGRRNRRTVGTTRSPHRGDFYLEICCPLSQRSGLPQALTRMRSIWAAWIPSNSRHRLRTLGRDGRSSPLYRRFPSIPSPDICRTGSGPARRAAAPQA
jgi:hypothetical protein